jgi:hypothetical protein
MIPQRPSVLNTPDRATAFGLPMLPTTKYEVRARFLPGQV